MKLVNPVAYTLLSKDEIDNLRAENKRLREALDIAEKALLNSIPITPYSGDGPLVKIRAL